MPFEIAPQFVPAEVEVRGPFWEDAEAMLRGAAQTRPCVGRYLQADEQGNVFAACALGAWKLGLGNDAYAPDAYDREMRMRRAYSFKYEGREPQEDFDEGRFTREQIAERIRTLR